MIFQKQSHSVSISLALLISCHAATAQNFFQKLFPPAPKINLAKFPKQIEQGDSVTISWHVINASSFHLANSSEQLPMSGSMTVKPDTFTIYKFIAETSKKMTKKNAAITVLYPEIVKFTALASATDEDSFALSWEVRNAATIRLRSSPVHPAIPDVPLNNSGTINIKTDTTTGFVLCAENKTGKKCEKKLTVSITLSEFIDNNPKRIISGDSVLIKWKFKKSNFVEILNHIKKYKSADSVYLSPVLSSGYIFRVHRNSGDTAEYAVQIRVDKPAIFYFTGSQTIFKSESGILKWSTAHADSVTLSGVSGTMPATGEYKVSPEKNISYKLTIYRKGVIVDDKKHSVRIIERRFAQHLLPMEKVKKGSRFDFVIFATGMDRYPEEIKLYVLVVDTAGNFITNLAPPFGSAETAKKYFSEVTETFADGNRHKVDKFTVTEIHDAPDGPYDINLTLDYSGSMSGSIDSLERAVRLYIENKSKEDRLSLVRFDDSIALEIPLTKSGDTILNSLKFNGLKEFGGGTALYAGTDEGLISLSGSKRKKKLVLFTDGNENSSFIYFGQRTIFAQQVAKKAREENVKIDVVSLYDGVNETLLKFFTTVTGGNYYNLQSTTDIIGSMNEISLINRIHYVISYKPAPDDRERKVALLYHNNAETKITAKEIYTGNDFDFTEHEFPKNAFWIKLLEKFTDRKPVAPPQTVALFDLDRSELKPEYHARQDVYVNYLLAYPQAELVIFGHTDHVGSDERCMELSGERAKAVWDYFTEKGADTNRIHIEVCGKNHPLWQIEDQPWKAKENRRVEIIIIE